MSRLKQTPADWSDPDISWHRCKFQRRCKHVVKFSHPQVGLNANSSSSGRGELGLSHLDSEDWKQQQQEEEEVWHLPLMSRQEGWWFSLVWFVGASCWLRPVLWLWLWSVGLGSRWEWAVAPWSALEHRLLLQTPAEADVWAFTWNSVTEPVLTPDSSRSGEQSDHEDAQNGFFAAYCNALLSYCGEITWTCTAAATRKQPRCGAGRRSALFVIVVKM